MLCSRSEPCGLTILIDCHCPQALVRLHLNAHRSQMLDDRESLLLYGQRHAHPKSLVQLLLLGC